MALTANVRHVGDVAVVDLDGRITLGESTGLLRDNLRQLFAQGSRKIILNMARVGYVDSAGLGELVGLYTTAKNQGAAIKLLNVQKKLSDLLSITKLHTVFEAYDNEMLAISSFGQSATA
jgi:anti-sigma B factor antagonist